MLLLAGQSAPHLVVRSFPQNAMAAVDGSGARVVVTARIDGEMNEEWYCAEATFIWPDGTKTTWREDCEPWDPQEIPDTPRSWSRGWNFPAGENRVTVELSHSGKVFAREQVTVRVVGGSE